MPELAGSFLQDHEPFPFSAIWSTPTLRSFSSRWCPWSRLGQERMANSSFIQGREEASKWRAFSQASAGEALTKILWFSALWGCGR